jgi:lipoprotein-anchoring transpeptidase ErfK/SrfK
MRRRYRPKYQLPRDRRRRSGWRYWGIALLALAVVGWFLWRSVPGGPSFVSTPRPGAKPASESARLPTISSSPTGTRLNPSAPPSNRVDAAIARPSVPAASKTNSETRLAGSFPRPVQDIFEAQVALGRQGISAGSIDGLSGRQTRAAIAAFQRHEHLPAKGDLDQATLGRLLLQSPAGSLYSVTAEDLSRLQPLNRTWVGKSQQSALEYETILELLAEKGHAHPNLLRRLNPTIDWSRVGAGTTVQLPDVRFPDPEMKAAFLVVRLRDKMLEAFDAGTNLTAHFPCSIARAVEKRPVGQLHVAVLAPNPNYTFDPDLFAESAEARTLKNKLVLPAGPNNPVGVAWIGLDRPGYGIHGTPNPEQVGRTESHGCFRLANWNAEYLLRLSWVGMPVYVEP